MKSFQVPFACLTVVLSFVHGDDIGTKTDSMCPCLPMDKCPRIFGESALDVQEFGFMERCHEFGTVRCCGVAIRIESGQSYERKLENSKSQKSIEEPESNIRTTTPVRKSIRRPITQSQSIFKDTAEDTHIVSRLPESKSTTSTITVTSASPDNRRRLKFPTRLKPASTTEKVAVTATEEGETDFGLVNYDIVLDKDVRNRWVNQKYLTQTPLPEYEYSPQVKYPGTEDKHKEGVKGPPIDVKLDDNTASLSSSVSSDGSIRKQGVKRKFTRIRLNKPLSSPASSSSNTDSSTVTVQHQNVQEAQTSSWDSHRKSTASLTSVGKRVTSTIPISDPSTAAAVNPRRFKFPIRFKSTSTTTAKSTTITGEPDTGSTLMEEYGTKSYKILQNHLARPASHEYQTKYGQRKAKYPETEDDQKETVEAETSAHAKYSHNASPSSPSPTRAIDTVNNPSIKPKYRRIRVQKPFTMVSGGSFSSTNVNTNSRPIVVQSQQVQNVEEAQNLFRSNDDKSKGKSVTVESKRIKVNLSPSFMTTPASIVRKSSAQTKFFFPAYNSRTPLLTNTVAPDVTELSTPSKALPPLPASTTEPPVHQVQTTEHSDLSVQVQPTHIPVPSTTPITFTSTIKTSQTGLKGAKPGRFLVPKTFKFKKEKPGNFHSVEKTPEGLNGELEVSKIQIFEPVSSLNKDLVQVTETFPKKRDPLSQTSNPQTEVGESERMKAIQHNLHLGSNLKPIEQVPTTQLSNPDVLNQHLEGMTYINVNSAQQPVSEVNLNTNNLNLSLPSFNAIPPAIPPSNPVSVSRPPPPEQTLTRLQSPHFFSALPPPIQQSPQFYSAPPPPIQQSPQFFSAPPPPIQQPPTWYHAPPSYQPRPAANPVHLDFRPAPVQAQVPPRHRSRQPVNSNAWPPVNFGQFRVVNDLHVQRPYPSHVSTQYGRQNQFIRFGQPRSPVQFSTKTPPHYVREYHQHHIIASEILTKLQNSVRTSRSANLTEEDIASLIEIASENGSISSSNDLLQEAELLKARFSENAGKSRDQVASDGNKIIPGEKVIVSPTENDVMKSPYGADETTEINDAIKDDLNGNGTFKAPKTIERGFIPILPYSEKDPGITVVNLNSKVIT